MIETTAKGRNMYLLNELKNDKLEKVTHKHSLMKLSMVDIGDLATGDVQALFVTAAGERIPASANEVT
jgi:hypothetical protein